MPRNQVTARGSCVTPYLCVDGARAAVRFYRKVFGAQEQVRGPSPDGRTGHAEITIGAALVILCDEDRERGLLSPRAFGGSAVTLSIDVEDVDGVYNLALEAGATPLQPIEDRGPGRRGGQFEDPFGHRWSISGLTGDVPVESTRVCVPLRSVKGATGLPPP